MNLNDHSVNNNNLPLFSSGANRMTIQTNLDLNGHDFIGFSVYKTFHLAGHVTFPTNLPGRQTIKFLGDSPHGLVPSGGKVANCVVRYNPRSPSARTNYFDDTNGSWSVLPHPYGVKRKSCISPKRGDGRRNPGERFVSSGTTNKIVFFLSTRVSFVPCV